MLSLIKYLIKMYNFLYKGNFFISNQLFLYYSLLLKFRKVYVNPIFKLFFIIHKLYVYIEENFTKQEIKPIQYLRYYCLLLETKIICVGQYEKYNRRKEDFVIAKITNKGKIKTGMILTRINGDYLSPHIKNNKLYGRQIWQCQFRKKNCTQCQQMRHFEIWKGYGKKIGNMQGNAGLSIRGYYQDFMLSVHSSPDISVRYSALIILSVPTLFMIMTMIPCNCTGIETHLVYKDFCEAGTSHPFFFQFILFGYFFRGLCSNVIPLQLQCLGLNLLWIKAIV